MCKNRVAGRRPPAGPRTEAARRRDVSRPFWGWDGRGGPSRRRRARPRRVNQEPGVGRRCPTPAAPVARRPAALRSRADVRGADAPSMPVGERVPRAVATSRTDPGPPRLRVRDVTDHHAMGGASVKLALRTCATRSCAVVQLRNRQGIEPRDFSVIPGLGDWIGDCCLKCHDGRNQRSGGRGAPGPRRG